MLRVHIDIYAIKPDLFILGLRPVFDTVLVGRISFICVVFFWLCAGGV